MSFFGFDSAPQSQSKKTGRKKRTGTPDKPLDFEETYQGFGEYENEEDDYLNDETFGNAGDLGTDFDFGYGKGEQENSAAPPASAVDQTRSYASAASAGPIAGAPQFMGAQAHVMDDGMDFTPMESLWTNQSMMMQQTQPPHHSQVLSMEELERQQHPQQMGISHAQQQGYMSMPPPPPMAYGYPPQAFMPQAQVMPNNGYPGAPHGIPPQNLPPHGMSAQGMAHPSMAPPQYQQPPMAMHQQPNPHSQQAQQMPLGAGTLSRQEMQQSPQVIQQPLQASSSGDGSAYATPPPQVPISQEAQGQVRLPQQTGSPRPQILSPSQELKESTPRGIRRSSMRKHQEPLSQDDFKRLQVRQAKVDKILRHSGVMTPRDKDFITRYQLSQIVTEDPYNEDFYFQVYKIIQRGGIVGESNKGLIARAYLEHSGHRLGGRYKRADVALQRMQSQVEKAVTVAKERPQKNRENLDSAKGGVLGKISSAKNSKAPRRQLQIPLQRDEDDEGSTSAIEEVVESLNGVSISASAKARRRSSYAFRSVDQRAVLSRSGGRKFVLSLIETVYAEVLELEALLRSGKETDSTQLWEALHISDDAYEVSPFISILSFDKGVKIMPRIFNFLNKEQKLKLLYCFFSELSHLNIIVTSSYKTNPDPTDSQLKKIELFQSVFLKIIVSFLSSSAEFLEVLGLLFALVKNNNVSFISTSKIGLNLVTVLISRAALIKQDVSRGSVLSTVEASFLME